MTFDLERARGLRDFLQNDCAEVGDVWGEMIAEIERLRASLTDLHAEYINTLEKNPECSAWDLDEQSDADQRRLRRNAAHAISIVEPPKQRRRARDAPGHVEGVRAMQMEMRTPVIKFRVEQDESGKIGYRVTKIEGFEEKKETDEEENEMQFTSTPRIYVRNENNHIILKIKSLMFTILTLEEGKIAENIRNQDDIDYWKHVMEAKTIYWNDTVVAYNERTPIVGSQTEMRINHRA